MLKRGGLSILSTVTEPHLIDVGTQISVTCVTSRKSIFKDNQSYFRPIVYRSVQKYGVRWITFSESESESARIYPDLHQSAPGVGASLHW